MKRIAAGLFAAIALAACGGVSSSTSSSEGTGGLSPSDAALHARAVAFQRAYMDEWHVSRSVAICVQELVAPSGAQRDFDKALMQHPHRVHIPGVTTDCTKP